MGEGDTVTELAELSANNNVAAEDKSGASTEKKNAEKDEIKEVEKESKEADEKDTENMDVDKEEVKESKADEEEKADQESKGTEEKPETKFEAMEEETAEKPDKDKDEVENAVNVQKEEKEIPEEHEVEKGSKKSDKSESGAKKKDQKRKRQVDDKKEEPKTPLTSKIERPVRQRKSVERLVATIEGELTKEIHIEKGRGTALKDIPNVAYKLSKMKADDTLKLLHTILFGRRGKAAQFKSNISQFSGFVWHENEEKQKMKVKEKLSKCEKEKLLELCDVLDIPDAKDTSRKEDLESQLMDFLVAPHPMTSELLAEKDQPSKGKKREKASKKSPLSGSTKSKAEKKKKNVHEPDQEEGPEEMKANGVQERSDDEMSNQAESEEEEGKSEEETEKDKKRKQSSKKEPSNSSKGSKKNDNNDANLKVYSKKKTTKVVKGKSSAPKKPSSKDNSGKKVLNGKGHQKADKLWPSDKELRSAICEILKEVDFNTATFTDIVQILGKRYDKDLTPRKTSVKNMIQDELTRLADEADEEDEEENAEEDEKQPSVQGVKA